MIRTIDVGEGGLIDTYTRFNFVCVKNDYDTWTDGLEDRKLYDGDLKRRKTMRSGEEQMGGSQIQTILCDFKRE